MHRVIAINLNGVAFQLDDTAYDALRAYLDKAEVQLKDNPDRAEIMADLEQAIGEKCSAFLGPHKTVVASQDIEQVIREMGPVDSGEAGGSSGEAGGQGDHQEKKQADHAAPRRLYNIREGALVSGVCMGIAAYFHVDVTIVRIIFVILAIVTKGAWLLAYGVLMFVVPYANTSEERAAAHGRPFSAQDLIDQAKQAYKGFDEKEWKRHWRDQRRQWRQQWRAQWRHQGRPGRPWGPMWVPPPPAMNWPGPAGTPMAPPAGYAAQVWAGLTIPIFGVIHAALFAFLLFSIVSLVNTHAILGWPAPPDIPLWGGILMLVAAYIVVSSPLHAIRQASAGAYRSTYPFAAWGGLLWIAFVVSFGWLAYQYMPEVRQFIHNLPAVWESFRYR